MKTCTLCNLSCIHAFMTSGTIGFGCNFTGYCDYQLPRDSRKQKDTY